MKLPARTAPPQGRPSAAMPAQAVAKATPIETPAPALTPPAGTPGALLAGPAGNRSLPTAAPAQPSETTAQARSRKGGSHHCRRSSRNCRRQAGCPGPSTTGHDRSGWCRRWRPGFAWSNPWPVVLEGQGLAQEPARRPLHRPSTPAVPRGCSSPWATVPASSFWPSCDHGRSGYPSDQAKEKTDLEASFPEVERPTGLPRQPRPEVEPTNLERGEAPEAKRPGGREGEPPETRHEAGSWTSARQ